MQNLQADFDFRHRRSRERDADGVADALSEQDSKCRRRLDRALELRAGLGDTEMERPVAALGEQPVGLHHHDRIVVLDRNLEVVEVVLFEEARLPHRTLDQGLCRCLAIFLHDARLERPRVHSDANRNACRLGGGGDLTDLVIEPSDVSGVDAHGADTGVDGRENVARLEVDVGNHRDLALARDDVQYIRVVLVRHRDAHDVTAGRGELGDLLEGGIDVGGLRRGHRLDAHLGITADFHLAN